MRAVVGRSLDQSATSEVVTSRRLGPACRWRHRCWGGRWAWERVADHCVPVRRSHLYYWQTSSSDRFTMQLTKRNTLQRIQIYAIKFVTPDLWATVLRIAPNCQRKFVKLWPIKRAWIVAAICKKSNITRTRWLFCRAGVNNVSSTSSTFDKYHDI